MTTELETLPVDFAALAREIAMDIYPLEDILQLHQLTDEQWGRIQTHPTFKAMLAEMLRDWNSASGTKERIRIKAATGLETMIETYINDISNGDIPLNQRVEAGKFLARLGELDPGVQVGGGGGGNGVTINIITKATQAPLVIEGIAVKATPEVDYVEEDEAR